MTSGTPATRTLTRREAREIAAAHAPAKPKRTQRRSGLRAVSTVMAALAAVGLFGGTIAVTGTAVAQADQDPSLSAYALAADEAQAYVSAADLAPAGSLQYGSYEVYVTPTPTPTPTPTENGGGGDEDAGGGGFAPPFVAPDPGTAQSIALDMVTARGWGESEFSCLVALWNKESGWNVSAYNQSSGAYGIPQSLPGNKMSSHGADWQTNPATQIAWGLDYISGRYGAPCGAWGFSQINNWY